MFQFPFGTMHQLNLDWFLQQWEIYKQEWADAQAGIDNALQGEIDRVEDAMTDLYNARDAAVQAKDDAQTAAGSALSDAGQAGADALKSEGFAVGEQDGTPVGAGSPYYQQNAKYYKVEAGTYRYLAEAYAKGEMGGSPVAPGEAGYQDNAKYYKDATAADRVQTGLDAASTAADALSTEGFAIGEQNGTPVSSGSPYYENNAKYYAGETQQDKEDADTFKAAAQTAALKAEGWAVGKQNGTPVSSGSPYYENNAEYYKDLAASVVLGADGAAAQAMIAGEEVSTTLTADYAAGSYIRIQGVLYQTDIDLQAGDTLTVGTNCHVAVIGDDLASQSEKIDNLEEAALYITETDCALENGTIVNPNNTNSVNVTTHIPCQYGDTVIMNPVRPNTSGYYYVFVYTIYAENGTEVSSETEFDASYGEVTINNRKASYIRFAFSEYNGSAFMPFRKDTFGYTPKAITRKPLETIKTAISDLESRPIAVVENVPFNLFDRFDVLIGCNDAMANIPSRAITATMIPTNGKSLRIKAFNLPSNLKYDVEYYSSSTATSSTTSTAWFTDNNEHELGASYPYIRVLFGSVDNQALTDADFVGLKLMLCPTTNSIQTYMEHSTSVDYELRSFPKRIRVASFNVGMYTKGLNDGAITDTTIMNMKKILCGINADVIGMQETRPTINDSTEEDTFYKPIYSQYWLPSTLGSRAAVSRSQIYDFTNDNAFSTSRYYMKGKIIIGDKTIDFYNFHLSPDATPRATELSEIITIINNSEYAICTGDFNVGNDTDGDISEYDVLKTAGFNLASCGYLGRINTYDQSGVYRALDNVITTPNIIIANAFAYDVSDEYNPSDHKPLVADLVIL